MLRIASIVSFFLMFLISAAHAQRNPEWVLLGEQSVTNRVNHDVIKVGQSDDWFRNRSFRTLQLVAERVEVYLMSIRLVYLNDHTEDFRTDAFIPQGGQLEVPLGGERSYLKQIELIYRSRPDFRGEAVIRVFGEPTRRVGGPAGLAPPPVRADDWAELGCQQVKLFGTDRDTIRVGRQEGRFKAIRLFVRGGDVEMLDLKVIYTNGQPDDIAVKNLIRAGERTRPLDLKGWERAIDRIDLTYRAVINPAAIIAQQGIREATVCVEGLR